MIPVGQPYRPAGTLDARSMLITTTLGVTAGMIGAGLVWLWEWSPIPTFVILTSLIQGLGVGAVMAFAVGRLRMRNPWVVAIVGFACGLLSAGLVHYGHYLHMVSQIAEHTRAEISEDKTLPEPERKSLLARLDADPAAFVDPYFIQETHHSGFLGSLILRSEEGFRLERTPVTGTFVWIIWGVEALAVAGIASIAAATRAGKPFCEECGYWCEDQTDLLTLPAASAVPVVDAIRDDSPSRVAALRGDPPVDDGAGIVAVSLSACPGCDQSFANVVHRIKKKKEMKEKSLLARHRVSPEVASAIRFAPEPQNAESEEFPEEDAGIPPEGSNSEA
jgi:hypothetical protein